MEAHPRSLKGHQEIDKHQDIILKHICLHFGMESLYLDIILRAVFRNADKVNSTLIFFGQLCYFSFSQMCTLGTVSLQYMFYQDQSLKK